MTPNIAERVESLKKRLKAPCTCQYGHDCENCYYEFEDIHFVVDLVEKYQKLVERADSLYSELAIADLQPDILVKWIRAREESGLFDSKRVGEETTQKNDIGELGEW